MSFTAEKKQQIKSYIINKVNENSGDNIARKTSELFGISLNTVYRYLRELEHDNILFKNNNGYSLETKYYSFKMQFLILINK